MDIVITLLLFFQALGAITGAFMAVWGEIEYVRAMRDGSIDLAERAHLDKLAHGLRFGMSFILLSSLGLVVVAYTQGFSNQPATTASYWVLSFFALLVVIYTWALSAKRVSFEHGSAVIFSAWWFLTYLVFGLLPLESFGPVLALFVVATAVFYGLLRLSRHLSTIKI